MKKELKDRLPPLLTHTTCFTIFAAVDAWESWRWGMTHGRAMPEAAVWASALPAGSLGRSSQARTIRRQTKGPSRG